MTEQGLATHDYHLLRVQNASRMLSDHEKKTRQYRALLDQSIKEAHDQGVTVVHLGLAARLSRVSIYKAITRAERPTEGDSAKPERWSPIG